jgi:hypothetical protein
MPRRFLISEYGPKQFGSFSGIFLQIFVKTLAAVFSFAKFCFMKVFDFPKVFTQIFVFAHFFANIFVFSKPSAKKEKFPKDFLVISTSALDLDTHSVGSCIGIRITNGKFLRKLLQNQKFCAKIFFFIQK